MVRPNVYHFCHLKLTKKQLNSMLFPLFSKQEVLNSADPTRVISTHHTCELIRVSLINTATGGDTVVLWDWRDLAELQLPLHIQKQPLRPLMTHIQYYSTLLENSIVIIKLPGVNRRFYSSALPCSKLFTSNNHHSSCEGIT